MTAVLSANPSPGLRAGLHVCGMFTSEQERESIVMPFLRLAAEMPARVATRMGPEELTAYERDVSDAISGGRLAALCQYDRRVAPRALPGEVDLTTAEHFAVLVAEHLPPSGDLHLDCGELTFIDAHGVRTLCRTVQALAPGHRVVVHRASAALRETLAILPVGGIVLAEAA